MMAPTAAVRSDSQVVFQNVLRMTGSPSAVRLFQVNAPALSKKPVPMASAVGRTRNIAR